MRLEVEEERGARWCVASHLIAPHACSLTRRPYDSVRSTVQPLSSHHHQPNQQFHYATTPWSPNHPTIEHTSNLGRKQPSAYCSSRNTQKHWYMSLHYTRTLPARLTAVGQTWLGGFMWGLRMSASRVMSEWATTPAGSSLYYS